MYFQIIKGVCSQTLGQSSSCNIQGACLALVPASELSRNKFASLDPSSQPPRASSRVQVISDEKPLMKLSHIQQTFINLPLGTRLPANDKDVEI